MSISSILEERTGIVSGWRAFTDRPWPGGPALHHASFAALVYLFVQQAVLGIVLSMYYSPSASDAWASTAYLTDQVTMGWFVRGLHDHGASAFVVLAVVHMALLAFAGAYRRPREAMWFAAVGVVGLALALGLSGNPLPWDEKGFWAIQVELGIAEQTPGGEVIRTLVQGGRSAGNLTLLRLFVVHAFVLPLLLGALLKFMASQRRRHGASASQAHARSTYAPGQFLLDMVVIAGLAIGLVVATVMTRGTELFAPADPTSGFQARPEWYFLFLYKLRHWFEGPLEPIATMVIPGAAVGFLLAAPFIERIAGRVGRVGVLVGISTLLAGSAALTVVAQADDRADEGYQKSLAEAEANARRSRELAYEGVDPRGGGAVFWNDPEYKVKALYIEHCRNCHAMDGFGGGEAPDLTDYDSREWLAGLIRNASDDKYFGKTKHDSMEPYPADQLDDEKLAAVVEYVVELGGDPTMIVDTALAATGKQLWNDDLDCSNCHEIEAGKDNEGPTLAGRATQAWVERVIRDSSKPDLFGGKAQMPKFADKLSDEEIAALAAFVLDRSG